MRRRAIVGRQVVGASGKAVLAVQYGSVSRATIEPGILGLARASLH